MFGLMYNVYDYLFSPKDMYIPVLGLDGAGKTTFIEYAKQIHKKETVPIDSVTPTVGLNIAKVKMGQSNMVLWDLSGQSSMRSMWTNFLKDANGLIYVIDSSNEESLQEAKETFYRLFEEGTLKKIPILLLANKQDVEGALSVNIISDSIDLTNLGDVKVLKILPTSAMLGTGVMESLTWMETKIEQSIEN